MGVRKTLKSLFNFSAWVGASELKQSGKIIKGLARRVFLIPRSSGRQETFEQAVERFRLTEKDIEERKKGFFFMVILYFALFIGLAVYCVYLFFAGTLASILMTVVLMGVIGALMFRQHFWYFQICERRLGCGLKEWLAFLAKSNKKKRGLLHERISKK